MVCGKCDVSWTEADMFADELPDLREFTITYRTPHNRWVLLSTLLPERYGIATSLQINLTA
jgi:hypothetical protein